MLPLTLAARHTLTHLRVFHLAPSFLRACVVLFDQLTESVPPAYTIISAILFTSSLMLHFFAFTAHSPPIPLPPPFFPNQLQALQRLQPLTNSFVSLDS